MSGTPAGGKLAAQRNLAKDPLFYKRIGSRGGSAPHSEPRGFAADPEKARLSGAKGGRISKRKKKDE